jgi:YbbR domain-containing protein
MKVDVRQRVVLWVRENGLVALLATVLALLVYMTILELVSNTTTRTVPVEVEREAGMALMSVRPSTVQVTFRGALNEFQILDRSDLRMVVNGLRNHGDQGIARITLRRKNLRGAGSVRVVSVEPSEIEVTFDHQGEREFTIARAKVEGRPLPRPCRG